MSSHSKRQTLSPPDTPSSVKKQKVVHDLFNEISQSAITPEPQDGQAPTPLPLTPRLDYEDDFYPSDLFDSTHPRPNTAAPGDPALQPAEPAPPLSSLVDDWRAITEAPEGSMKSDDHEDNVGSTITPARLYANAVDSVNRDEYSATGSNETKDARDEVDTRGSQDAYNIQDDPSSLSAFRVQDAVEAHDSPFATELESPPNSEGAAGLKASSASPGVASVSVSEASEATEEDNMAFRVNLKPLRFNTVVGKPWREQQDDTERFMQDVMAELAQLTADTHAWASLKVVQVDQTARDIIYTHMDAIDQMESADFQAKLKLVEFHKNVTELLLQLEPLSSM